VAARRLRARQAEVAGAVAVGADVALAKITESLATAQAGREAAEQASKGRTGALKEVRARVRALAGDLDRVVDTAHGAEVTKAEQRMRLEQVVARAAEQFGVDTDALIAEYGPRVPVPVPDEADTATPGRRARPAGRRGGAPAQDGAKLLAAANGDDTPDPGRALRAAGNGHGTAQPAADPAANDGEAVDGAADRGAPMQTIPYVRAEQEKRAATAQRQLDQLGKVNPLALEEYAALEERHAFLANQLEDLKKTRRDLLTVVKEVDDRVQEVFTSAFADTAAEFEQIFARLFPGGEGRLVLTEPDDMLATGIDIEARPPGKKVKRLSLLSGGERSLTAIAFLLAIFRARPSPFYVLDEVEAALDDTNLQRLLEIFEELRGTSQLIVVTHQKRTMEVADALYGTSMQGDGVSMVVSQRLRERERA
jgi:chromosome segregation protein